MNKAVTQDSQTPKANAPAGWRARISHGKAWVAASLMTGGTQVLAQGLPTTAAPSRGGTSGNYIEMGQNYAYDIFVFIGLLIATVAFVLVTKNTMGAYGEVQDGKGTWGQVGMQFGVGVLLLVFVIFLMTEASGIL